MRVFARLRAGRQALAVLAFVLLPGVMLGYFGLSGLAEREENLRASYRATTSLVRDRLTETLDRLHADLPTPANPADLLSLSKQHAWVAHPFILRADGCVILTALSAACRQTEADPLAGLRDIASFVSRGEDAEFVRDDLISALRAYREALARVPSPAVSGRLFVLSRVGRTEFKLLRFADSVATYQRLVAQSGDTLDRYGLPYRVAGLLQLCDLFDALGRPEDRAGFERQLAEYVVGHPWDSKDGYGTYLTRAAVALQAEPGLAARVRDLTTELATVEWIRDQVGKQLSAPISDTRIAVVRSGTPVLLGFRRTPAEAGGRFAKIFGYEIPLDVVGGPLLTDVLKTVSLGNDIRVAITTSLSAERVLAKSELLPGVSSWQVALFDREGRSVDELAHRERWTYGVLIVGMLTVMLLGVAVTTRAAARANELARLQAEFVSNVSHELKTPLALIRMFGETLESGIVADPIRREEFHGIIRRESERLTVLINNVLDVGRIENGMKSYDLRRHDLIETVRDALEAYRPLFDRLGFQVEATFPGSAIDVVIDREAIIQALVNLFQNVIKYSGESRFVAISVERRAAGACVSVADRGVGIPNSHFQRIFDRHYRVPALRSTGSAGSGLGLAIVKHIADAHGGHVDVSSVVGQGSVFTLVLPLRDVADGVAGHIEREEARA